MALLPADYVVIGVTILLIAFGLLRGFSGAFAFLAAVSLGAGIASYGWTTYLAALQPIWWRAVASVLVFILAFAVIRYVVKTLIGKLLTQPSDSIFGVVLGLFNAGLLIWVLATNPSLRDYSQIAGFVHRQLTSAPHAEVSLRVR